METYSVCPHLCTQMDHYQKWQCHMASDLSPWGKKPNVQGMRPGESKVEESQCLNLLSLHLSTIGRTNPKPSVTPAATSSSAVSWSRRPHCSYGQTKKGMVNLNKVWGPHEKIRTFVVWDVKVCQGIALIVALRGVRSWQATPDRLTHQLTNVTP